MKKTFKTLLSLLLVLIFAVQFAGALGFADDEAKISGKESLVYDLLLVNPDPEAEDKLIPVTAEREAELLNMKPYSITVERQDENGEKKTVALTRMPGGIILDDLLKGDLVITPAEGFVIQQAYLCGDKLTDAGKAKRLPFTAEKDKASLTLKAAALAVEEDAEGEEVLSADQKMIFNEDLFSSFSTQDPPVYTLVVVFAAVDAEKELTVTESLDQNAEEKQTKLLPGQSYTAADAPEDTLTRQFDCWQVRYGNGAVLTLMPGDSFLPFADCTITAQWTDIITITANAPVQENDVFVSNFYTYQGQLAEGDAIDDVTLTVSEQDGKYVCTPSAAVIKHGKKDVTDQYALRYVASDPVEKPETPPEEVIHVKTQITITAKPPITTDEGKTYTGNGYEITAGALTEGDSIASITITVRQNDEGKFLAVPSAAVIKNGETDNTENYDILYQESEGVEPPVAPGPDPEPEKIALTIRSKDRSAEYNGSLVTANEYELTAGALAEGDSIQVAYTGGSTNVTSSPAVSPIASVVIKDKDGVDVTETKYTVTIDNDNAGKVTVTPHTVTITAITGSVTTNGNKVIDAKDCATADKTFEHGYKAEGLLPGHELRGDFVKGSGKETFVTSIDKNAVQILDVSNNNADVTANYNIKTVDGKLTINVNEKTNIPVAVTTKEQVWTYDGTAHKPDQAGYNISGLLDGDVATVKLQIKQDEQLLDEVTDAGTYTIVPVITIKDKNGAAVSPDKYKITAATANLTVKRYELTLEAVSASKAYDGKALVNNNVKATALVSGHKFRDKDGVKFTVTDAKGNLMTNGVINVGTYTKKVTEVHIVDAKGNDVTTNYIITKIDGKLTITQGITPQNDSNQPRTGDDSNSTLFIIMLIASALLLAAIAGFLVLQKKKKQAVRKEPVYEDPIVEPEETTAGEKKSDAEDGIIQEILNDPDNK